LKWTLKVIRAKKLKRHWNEISWTGIKVTRQQSFQKKNIKALKDSKRKDMVFGYLFFG
jgi:hypothetical protein